MLLNQVRFAQRAASQSAEVPGFAAKRVFNHKAAKRGDGITSLKSASPKARGSGYLWDRD